MENNIIKGNKLIAGFDGKYNAWKYKNEINEDEYPFPLQYHSSLDWLMPVVSKIGDIENQADIEFAEELDKFKESKQVTIFSVSVFAPIGLVYECVNDFIEWWYNKEH